MEFKTVPPAAKVTTSNGKACDSTPCSLKMARNSEFDAVISKPGYRTLTVHVTHKISGSGGAGMAGNVLVGGLIGAGVDVATGAMYDLTPNPVDVILEKDEPPPAHAAPVNGTSASSAAPAATPAAPSR